MTDALKKLSKADMLLIAAFLVATFRQMGVNGHFIGFDPATNWAWFQPVEVWSGLAMAALEGLALAYISRRWRRLEPKTMAEWTYWTILLVGMIIILLSILAYVAMYGFAAQRGSLVAEVFGDNANMFWNVMVAGVVPLIAIMIGIVADEKSKDEEEDVLSEEDEAWLALVQHTSTNGKLPMADELALSAGVKESTADKVLIQAARNGWVKH